MMTTLEWRELVAQRRTELKFAQEQLFESLVREHHYSVGDIMVDDRGNRGKVVKFVWFMDGVSPVLINIKADGSLGKKTINTAYSMGRWRKE